MSGQDDVSRERMVDSPCYPINLSPFNELYKYKLVNYSIFARLDIKNYIIKYIYTQQKKLRKLCLRGYDKKSKTFKDL